MIHDEKAPSEKYDASMDVAENDLATILKSQPVKTWSRGSLHLYAVCLLVYLCSTMNGESIQDSKHFHLPLADPK
jgi:hypothetical protein